MLGITPTEFVLETIIRDGLGDLRANPDKFDKLFMKFTQAHFNNQYGQDHIEMLKTYIQEAKIRIVHSYSQVPTYAPCFSLQILRSEESERDQQFGDYIGDDEVDKTPTQILDPVTPTAYEAVTGKLSIDDAINLGSIAPLMVFVDADSNEFAITGVSNLAGNKYIIVDKNATINSTSDGKIQSPVSITRTERRMIRLRESVSIGCHATDQVHLAKYLYYILVFIIKTRTSQLIDRGIELDKGSGNMFDRVDDAGNQNIYSRFLDISCLTEFEWDDGEVNLIDCFDLDLTVEQHDEKFNPNTSG